MTIQLRQDQIDFLAQFTKERYASWFETFWADQKMLSAFDETTKETLRKIEHWDGGYVRGKCECGRPIRYHWIYRGDDRKLDRSYGCTDIPNLNIQPGNLIIGSTCIHTFTGLPEDVIEILKHGMIKVNREREDIITQLEEAEGDFERWKDNFGRIYLEDKVLAKLDADEQDLLDEFLSRQLPLPFDLRKLLKRKRFEVQADEQRDNLLKNYPDVKEAYIVIEQLSDIKIYQLFPDAIKTAKDIRAKIGYREISTTAIDYMKKLACRLSNEEAIEAMEYLVEISSLMNPNNYWATIIDDLIIKGSKYGFTEPQINLVLRTTSKGKPGIKQKFNKLIEEKLSKQEAA